MATNRCTKASFYDHTLLSLAYILYRNIEVKDRKKCTSWWKRQFKTYKSCFIMSELIDYLLTNHFCTTRKKAIALQNILCEKDIIYRVPNESVLYCFKEPSKIFQCLYKNNKNNNLTKQAYAKINQLTQTIKTLKKDQQNEYHILELMAEHDSEDDEDYAEQEATVVQTVDTSALMEEIKSNPAINVVKHGNREIGVSHYLVQSRYELNNTQKPVEIQIKIVEKPKCICNASLQHYEMGNVPSYNGNNIICDICDEKINKSTLTQLLYHCPNGKSETHKHGYDLCIDCGIDCVIEKTWNNALKRAINIVNNTCPGIHIIYKPQQINIDKVIEIYSKNNDSACTWNNVKTNNKARIELGTKWSEQGRYGTALHELLHALGLKHEHKRADRNKFGVFLNEEKCKERYGSGPSGWDEWKYQYQKADENRVHGITTYDPHSIMNYNNCDGQFDIDNKYITCYHVNSAMTGKGRRNKLSPLDEIGLNLLWRPCTRDWYKPVKNTKTTSLYYCGRVGATFGHNYPGNDRTDGTCGPNNGANCAACRVLKNNDIAKINDENRVVWQGSSGYFYCGKYIGKQKNGHDGYCGPNNGTSCTSCNKLIR